METRDWKDVRKQIDERTKEKLKDTSNIARKGNKGVERVEENPAGFVMLYISWDILVPAICILSSISDICCLKVYYSTVRFWNYEEGCTIPGTTIQVLTPKVHDSLEVRINYHLCWTWI